MKRDYSVLISSEDNNASSFPKQKKLTISKKEMQQYANRHNCGKSKRELTLCLSMLQNALNSISKDELNQSKSYFRQDRKYSSICSISEESPNQNEALFYKVIVPSAEDEVIQQENEQQIKTLAQKITISAQEFLTKKEIEVFRLHFIEHISASSIAAETNRSRPAITKLIKSIRRKMKKRFEDIWEKIIVE